MKNFIPVLFSIMLIGFSSKAQVVVFSDDFENASSPAWLKTGTWGTTTTQKHNGNQSMADSPLGFYGNNVNSDITMANGVTLDSAMDAQLTFWAIYDIENGFDYVYLEASKNNGATWTNLATFNGEGNLTTWTKYTYSLGGFLGFSNVKIRFRFYSDPGYTVDGIFIDDLMITKDTVDKSPPLILHTSPADYLSSLGSQFLEAEIVDTSGVGIADLIYMVDGGTPDTIHGINTLGDKYSFTVPPQSAGSWVDYFIMAADTAIVPNEAVTDTFNYITGNHFVYDNGVVSFINSFGPTAASGLSKVGLRVTIPGATQLVTALIRNYTDINNPNDSIDVHVWQDSSGFPGADLIPPIRIFPEADLLHPHVMTRVDLRPYAASLSGITGDVFIGFSVPSGRAWTQYTSGGGANRSFTRNATAWTQALGTDYHFRLVTDFLTGAPIAGFSADTVSDPTITFTDTSKNSPVEWWWEFGDGNVDSVQHPSHTYAQNGIYQVCLEASNSVGSDKACSFINIRNVTPIADFGYSLSNDPIVHFTDWSLNNPTNWEWNFGDDSPIDFTRHPNHQFDSNKTYQVCMKAYNSIGADSVCKTLTVSGYVIPVADFGLEQTNNNTYVFTDSSSNNPTAWRWGFGNGLQDSVQNPIHSYASNGNFSVCLVASNGAGSSTPVCKTVSLTHVGVGNEVTNNFRVYPNPARDELVVETMENEVSTITIRDLTGREMKTVNTDSGSRTVISISDLNTGTYLVEIRNVNGVRLEKLIIQ